MINFKKTCYHIPYKIHLVKRAIYMKCITGLKRLC